MKIEIKMTETVEEIIGRIIEEKGIVAYEYAKVTHNGNEARIIIGGDMLNMDLRGAWNHKCVMPLHVYFDVYLNDDDKATTYWVEEYSSVISAFYNAITGAMVGVSR